MCRDGRPQAVAAAVLLTALGLLTSFGHAESAEKPSCPKFKTLCIQADDLVTVDQITGAAEFRGGVRGLYTPQELTFQAKTVLVFQDQEGRWSRLELVRDVRLTRPDVLATAQRAQMDERRVILSGNPRVEQPPQWIEGEEIVIEGDPERVIARGSDQRRARMLYQEVADPQTVEQLTAEKLPAASPTPVAESAAGSQGSGPTPEAPELERIEATGQELIFDDGAKAAILTGDVLVTQATQQMTLKSQAVRLNFDDQDQFTDFRAEGGVHISQPGRTLTSDVAQSRDNNRTILLIGNARIQQGEEFKLASDLIEVYADKDKGVVKSDEARKPLSLSFELQPKENREYRLTRKGFGKLAGQGLPTDILTRLAPLEDRRFPDREALSKEVEAVLLPEERTRFLTLIIETAK